MEKIDILTDVARLHVSCHHKYWRWLAVAEIKASRLFDGASTTSTGILSTKQLDLARRTRLNDGAKKEKFKEWTTVFKQLSIPMRLFPIDLSLALFLCSRRSSAAHGDLRFACSLSPKNISREQKECGMLLCIPTHLEQIFQLIQSLASLITIDLRGRALTSIAAFLTK